MYMISNGYYLMYMIYRYYLMYMISNGYYHYIVVVNIIYIYPINIILYSIFLNAIKRIQIY